MLLITAFIYSSQVIYFKIFRTFYSAFSTGNTTQVLEFSKDVLKIVASNIHWIILLFILPIISFIFSRRKLTQTKFKWYYKLAIILLIVIVQLSGLAFINFNNDDINFAYNLYFNKSSIKLSVNKLGLLTSMRLDIQRLLTDWSPNLVKPELSASDYSNSNQKEESKKEVKEEKIEYNTMNIDFKDLISKEKNETIKEMHKYFNNVEPSSKSDGEYVACTGLLPKNEVWSFNKSSNNFLPFVMGNQLEKLAYEILAYHNHYYSYYDRDLSHPNMGYDYKGLGNGLDIKETWPGSDLEMMEWIL